jgi:hypothetical protein
MIPDELEPTLSAAQPAPPQLDDGFSPPAVTAQAHEAGQVRPQQPVDPALWAKSDF